MIVNSVNGKYNPQYNPAGVNFKQGLTRDIVTHVKNMPSDEYQKITHKLWKKYGMIADVGCSNTVAFCVEQTADIMKRAGFNLPKYFKFQHLHDGSFGEYGSDGIVKINSDKTEFLDLVQLDKLEEQTINYNDSKHFLDVYLHEFLHNAHGDNIIEKKGTDRGEDIFWDELTEYAPYYNLRVPLLAFIKNLFPQMTFEERIDIFPEKFRIHESKDLTEYFAEKNARKIEIQLGDNFNIDNIQPNMAQSYSGFPKNWKINDEVRKIIKFPFFKKYMNGLINPDERNKRITETLKDILNCYEGEIWNGNIDGMAEKTGAFRDYGKKHANK